jgi:hypothetical protein
VPQFIRSFFMRPGAMEHDRRPTVAGERRDSGYIL